MHPMKTFLDRVNRTKVTATLLGEVLELHAAMPAKDRMVFEVRAIRLFELLDKKGLGNDGGDLAMAINFRLTALAKLHDEAALRAWTMAGKERGMNYVSADLLAAAAEEPLVEDAQGDATFDIESFRRRVLSRASAEGTA